jgi:hypothetical protein
MAQELNALLVGFIDFMDSKSFAWCVRFLPKVIPDKEFSSSYVDEADCEKLKGLSLSE